MVAPAAMDKTISASWASVKLNMGNMGAIIPAAVIIATVAEPCVILTIAAKKYASTIGGKLDSEIASANIVPMPLSTKICLKTPPAPVIKIIIPAGPSDLVLTSNNLSLPIPRFMPRKYSTKGVLRFLFCSGSQR